MEQTLCGKSCTTLAHTALEYTTPGFCSKTRSKPMRSGALSLFWLIVSLHDATIPYLELFWKGGWLSTELYTACEQFECVTLSLHMTL